MSKSSTRCAPRVQAPSRPDSTESPPLPGRGDSLPVVLSFDVEEHHRIEAAAGMVIAPELQERYRGRMRDVTAWIVDRLAELELRATFFIVGQIGRTDPGLVRAIHNSGHEVASHG